MLSFMTPWALVLLLLLPATAAVGYARLQRLPGRMQYAPTGVTPWEGWAAFALLALLLLSGEWWYYVRRT